MLRVCLLALAALFFGLGAARAAHATSHHKPAAPPAPEPDYSAFYAGGLHFTMPPKWIATPAGTTARGGEWRIPPPRGATGDEAAVIAYFFGAGRGGPAKDAITDWIGQMSAGDEKPVSQVTTHRTNGDKISEVVITGTFSQPVPLAGMPPQLKADYALIGAVVENSQGNIYWRLVGPQPLVAANRALFEQMLDTVQSQAK